MYQEILLYFYNIILLYTSMRLLTLTFASLLFPASLIAQSKNKFENTWYSEYNEAFRWCRGRECTIRLTKIDSGYQLTHDQDRYTDHLPPDGIYTLNESGELFHGHTRLWMKGDNLYSNFDRLMVFESKEAFVFADSVFPLTALYLDSAGANSSKLSYYVRKAAPILAHLIEAHPYDVESYFNRMVSSMLINDPDSATKDYFRIVKLDSNYERLEAAKELIVAKYQRIAWDKHGKKDQFEQALSVLNKALQLEKNSANLWYNIGGASYSCRKYKAAILAFKRALELNPELEEAQQGLDAAMDKNKK